MQRYEGKAKILYPLAQADTVTASVKDKFPKDAWVQEFKDDLTAFDGKKKDRRVGKGARNQQISTLCYQFLSACGFETHLFGSLDERTQVIRRLQMLPVEVIMRRMATGSLVRRLGVEEKKLFHPPLFEMFLKNDALGDPLMAPSHVPILFPDLGPSLIQKLELVAFGIFGHLEVLFKACDLTLVDGKFEFGFWDQTLVLGDEISPDTLRIWTGDGRKLDKDVFRHDLGDVMTTYDEILMRLRDVNLDTLAQTCVKQGVACRPFTLRVDILPQEGVLDPEGQAAQDVMGHSAVRGVRGIRAGRVFELEMNRVPSGFDFETLNEEVKQVLANPLIQDWQISLSR
jgi:phosphoribosylaminoimidazole-succinocarboxamide synthase